MTERDKHILVAGIGNLWLKDDGFGGEVARRLGSMDLPDGVIVSDYGIGGLDLAYEVMRGYDALILIDISRQGGEPGTLYVIDVEENLIEGEIEDGAQIDPHGMDPRTVLRFVKATGGWPGRVMVIACEPTNVPTDVSDMGMGLSDPVKASVDSAVQLVLDTIEELRSDAAYRAP
jgi:hydrogenase maturation protease